MKIGKFCELFLRQAAFKPQLAASRTQDASRIGIRHKFITKALTTTNTARLRAVKNANFSRCTFSCTKVFTLAATASTRFVLKLTRRTRLNEMRNPFSTPDPAPSR
jgi:hypothetical protein